MKSVINFTVAITVIMFSFFGCRSTKNTDELIQETEISKFFVINLDRSPERWQNISQNFQEAGVVPTRFSATDKNDLSLDDLISQNVYDPDEAVRSPYGAGRELSMGELGNYLSHSKVLREIVDKDLGVVAVFEDDAKLDRDFQSKVQEVLSVAPENWDRIYLGCNMNFENNCQGSFEQVPGTSLVKLDSRCIAGNWAFLTNPQGASKVLGNLFPIINASDTIITKKLFSNEAENFDAYCVAPEIVSLGEDQNDSTIGDRPWE